MIPKIPTDGTKLWKVRHRSRQIAQVRADEPSQNRWTQVRVGWIRAESEQARAFTSFGRAKELIDNLFSVVNFCSFIWLGLPAHLLKSASFCVDWCFCLVLLLSNISLMLILGTANLVSASETIRFVGEKHKCIIFWGYKKWVDYLNHNLMILL